MPRTPVDITTPEATFTTEIVTPEGPGPWPAVVQCYDAGGFRRSMYKLAERIAALGYLVAIPDFYHRSGPVTALLPPGTPLSLPAVRSIFSDPELRGRWSAEYYGPAVDYEHLRTDVGALLDYLQGRADVTGRVGTTGYCMGGNVSLRLATLFGDRIAATACFHGGGLATGLPDSPHLRARGIRSRVYVAGAVEDSTFTDEMKAMLVAALEEAGVDHTVETYPARHGFAVADSPSFDEAAAERHYRALETLFAATLRA
jgi:carboxymethylenebutenolidase